MKYFYVALGGGIGALFRFLLSRFIHQLMPVIFPLGTMVVNLTGCFLIGFLSAVFDTIIAPPNLRLFLIVGILGGFTTFSSFGMETVSLLRAGEYKYAGLNLLISNGAGVIMVFIGFILARWVLLRWFLVIK